MQAKIESPQINQGCLEASPTLNAHIFAYTKNDVEVGTSNVVTGQLSVANKDAHVLFYSGATHSFTSHTFVRKLNQFRYRINQTFRTAFPL